MLYKFAHLLQDKVSCIWSFIEWGNSVLFVLRYRKKLKCIPLILKRYGVFYQLRQAGSNDIDGLIKFFESQPQESYKYFKPHKFDVKTIQKLIERRSYLFFVVLDNQRIIGYYFLRCFFMGKSYLGKLVDDGYRGKGIGQLMCISAMEIASSIGLHMYETISKDNMASLYSSSKVLDVRIIEEMDNNYIYVEDFPKGTLTKTIDS